jgi:hypothetical protein
VIRAIPIDELVVVGGWCVDRYQATVCDGTRLGADFAAGCISNSNRNNGGLATHDPVGSMLEQKITSNGALLDPRYRAYSKRGIVPTRYVSYFQAVAACVNADKVVIPDAVYVAAALGTFFPDPNMLGAPRRQPGTIEPRASTSRPSILSSSSLGSSPGFQRAFGCLADQLRRTVSSMVRMSQLPPPLPRSHNQLRERLEHPRILGQVWGSDSACGVGLWDLANEGIHAVRVQSGPVAANRDTGRAAHAISVGVAHAKRSAAREGRNVAIGTSRVCSTTHPSNAILGAVADKEDAWGSTAEHRNLATHFASVAASC